MIFPEPHKPEKSRSKTPILFAAFESPLAIAGGLGAVACRYTEHVQNVEEHPIYGVTPFHSQFTRLPAGSTLVRTTTVDWEGRETPVEIFQCESNGVAWYVIRSPGFFAADESLYLYSRQRDPNQNLALRDAVFFCKALPQVLDHLAVPRVVLHLSDWQCALGAVSAKDWQQGDRESRRVACVLSMHNPYDCGMTTTAWSQLTNRLYSSASPPTVLGIALPHLDGPVMTVSREFADDLRTTTLQTRYFADHLQGSFRAVGVVGVDNGPFFPMVDPFAKAL